MADHERDTLRTEVRAFRKLARWLSDPTAGRLADLMRIEEQINLTAMLPLVDVDLFAAVPDVGHRSASTTMTGEVRIRPGDAGGPTQPATPGTFRGPSGYLTAYCCAEQ